MSADSSAVQFDAATPVATITIDRPERRNAINPAVVAGIRDALSRAEEDRAIRALVLTGAGDKAFCAGADLGGMIPEGKVAQHHQRADVGRLLSQMRESRLPLIARVNGLALAGGFGLMLACDLVVAAEDVEMGTPEIDIGLWPFMITAVIQRDLPRKLALELMLTGRRMKADEAKRWGVVNSIVPRETLDEETRSLASKVASKSALIASLGKRSFYRAEDLDFDAALDYLSAMLTVCLESEDTVEGISAWMAKRAPEWKDR